MLLPRGLQTQILRVLGEKFPWRLEVPGKQNEIGVDLFGNTLQKIGCEIRDVLLGTGLIFPFSETYDSEPLSRESEEFGNYESYGFSSQLEMIMSLSAYRCKEVMQWKNNQYEWINSQGIRNVITACTHGDPKFFQYQESIAESVYSPYGNKVNFAPRRQIGSMTQVYHLSEPSFFATFLRYAYESGKLKDIMGEKGEKFILGAHNLPGILGHFGDAGEMEYMDSSEMMGRLCIPIGGSKKWRNTHKEGFGPHNQDGEKNTFYEFRVSKEGNLELYNAYTESIDMIFYPEDCENLLKGILHQCAYGHGRTSKTQILNLVGYVYSNDFADQVRDIEGLEIPPNL